MNPFSRVMVSKLVGRVVTNPKKEARLFSSCRLLGKCVEDNLAQVLSSMSLWPVVQFS